MGEKQAWVEVPMTNEEVEKWLTIQNRGFVRFAIRWGVVFVGGLTIVLLVLHFAVNRIDGIPNDLRTLPLLLLFGLPVLGPIIACVVCGITWRLQAEKYRNTVRQQNEGGNHGENRG
jgi:hypothetical protein